MLPKEHFLLGASCAVDCPLLIVICNVLFFTAIFIISYNEPGWGEDLFNSCVYVDDIACCILCFFS